jgi:CRP/FNR family transcriptional regulator, cyclic AMP receptor protein
VATTADVLGQVPLFSLLDAQERAALAERVEHVPLIAGTTLFHTGDPGDSLYVVLSGSVEIYFKNDTGERIVLERAAAGHFFGEISLLDSGPRTASAFVAETGEALLIDRGDIENFLKSQPNAALDLLTATGRRLREAVRLLRHTASRNVNEEAEDNRSVVQRGADWISDFSGSLPFLFIHCGVFFLWIVLNIRPLADTVLGGFDPFPFGLLTMSVSLEAIILSVFVLLSQNRQVARDRVRNEIEYDVNLKAELEVAHLHEKFDRLYEELGRRLQRIERATGVPASETSVAPRVPTGTTGE